jgi:multicomponent Na+:H+ antiporter subunit F
MGDRIFTYYIIVLSCFAFFCLYRAYKGPSSADRVLAVNVILTKTVVILCVMSILYDSTFFIDIAFVYSLIGFIGAVALAKFLQSKNLSGGGEND